MLRPRVIPCLLLEDGGLVKTVGFKRRTYIGDPVNAVKIFNDKEADELLFLDISATRNSRAPDFSVIQQIAAECFMPLCYGGGITTLDDMARLFSIGIEKACINTSAIHNPSLVSQAAERFGSQSVVVSIDVKRSLMGKYQIVTAGGTNPTGLDPIDFARKMERLGAGEIILTSIDRDGTMKGYDTEILRTVTTAVRIPVIASGGAGVLADLKAALREGGASGAAAGSMFVFHGKHRAVLISYPAPDEIDQLAKA
jgi:cyclase